MIIILSSKFLFYNYKRTFAKNRYMIKQSNTKISLTEYAKDMGMTRQAAHKRLSRNDNPGISRVEKVGNTLTLYKSPTYAADIKNFKNS